ncbi:MAG TPA: OmpH family outer membrane protein [Caulobacteraceae bacterium]|nr:OmpH family outer membrane protein [Caulobacteraceae bacterium]
MNSRSVIAAGACAAAIVAMATAAMAQPARRTASEAAPTAANIAQGPPIPGLCIFSPNAIVSQSKVGKVVFARLKELSQQVDAELRPEYESITTEGHTLEAQRATMDQAAYQARGANLQLQASNFEKKRALRAREMQATQEKALDTVGKVLNPIMVQLYQQRHCSVLIDGDAGGVKLVNPSMDLSPVAVTALDARIQTLAFDRVHLDSTPASASAPVR